MPSTRRSGATANPTLPSKRSTRPSSKPTKPEPKPKRSPSPATIERQLHASGTVLLHAASKSPLSDIQRLLKSGNHPIWYQDLETGWSALHFAAERGEPEIINALLRAGAVWNAVDHLGLTAGDVALSIDDEVSYRLIRDEGLRSEMLHHAMQFALVQDDDEDEDEEEVDTGEKMYTKETPAEASGPGSGTNKDTGTVTNTATLTGTSLSLKNTDTTSAGSNLTFLSSKLIWETGDDGLERVMDEDGNGVMMGWEEPLMRAHVEVMCKTHPEGGEGGRGLSILNVGFGLGIIDSLFQSLSPPPTHHAIIEAHPSVLAHIHSPSVQFDKKHNVKIFEGRWQDYLDLKRPDGMEKVLEGTPGGMGFDVIFVDTFAEGYEDLKAFFEFLPDLLNGPDAVFSFWNGLGATNALIYDVASNLAELHLDGVGLSTTWHDVPVPDATAEVTWKGVKRKYWTMPVYKLPVSKMTM